MIATEVIEEPKPWYADRGQVVAYALSLVRDGTLSIDDEGRVWRHYNLTKKGRISVPTKRAENPTRKGYLAVTLGIRGEKKTRCVYAHVLVWTHLHGPIKQSLQVNHIDLDKTNNRPGNLELLTGSGNTQHAYDNGRARPWSDRRTANGAEWRPGRAMLTQEQRQQVVEMRKAGHTYREIQQATGISKTHISRIARENG